MTGVLSWKSILEYVSSYNPLDPGVCLGCDDFASSGFAISGLLSGLSTAEYGYLGYLVLFIQKQGTLGLRTSVIFANFQKGLGALFRVFFVYMAKFRMGLVRMTLYTYATFMAGSQLLWACPSKRSSSRRLFLFAQLSMLTVGYAGEGTTSDLFRTQLKKAEEKSTKKPEITIPASVTGTEETCCGGGALETMAHQRCTCHFSAELLVGCRAPAATARESCVCFLFGEQYNWRPHVCPTLGEGSRDGLRTCSCPKFSCTEKENRENSPVKDQTKGPKDTREGMDYVSRQLQRENARKMRNRIRKKLFAAKLPGVIFGTVLAAVFSSDIFIKISTVVTMISYNLFFWMGAQFYELGEMENYDIMDEKKSGEMEKHDKKDKKKIDGKDVKDGKQIPDALVPELKKTAEVVLKLLPLWLTFASTCYLVNATADTLFMEQVDYLEKNTQSQSFKIPKSVFYSFPDIVSNITGQVCHCLIEQFHNDNKKRWARLLRISIGMVFSSFCCIVASLVAHRFDCNYNSASLLWLLPQFFVWGMMKGIMEEGVEEFLHDHQDNDSQVQAVCGDNDSQVQAVCGNAESVGNFLNMILIAISPSSWVGSGNDISKSHLDYYYRMLAIITLSSTFLFTIVAIAYELREKECTKKNEKKC